MTPRHPAPPISAAPLDALLHAHAQSSQAMAVFLIGGGAWVSTALLSLAYMENFSEQLRYLPYAATVLALLWLAIGAVVLYRQHRTLQACSHAYEAALQPLRQARTQPAASTTGWTTVANLFQPAPASPVQAAAALRGYARPVSLFGAYDAQHTPARGTRPVP